MVIVMTPRSPHTHPNGAANLSLTPGSIEASSTAQFKTPESLLCYLCGQPMDETAISHGLIFLAVSITLLSGVMAIDGQIDPQEKSYLQSIIDASVQSGNTSPQLVQALVDGIEQHQVYLNPPLFVLLASGLSESERILLLGLGYDMATTSEHFGPQERMYLRAIAQRLRIPHDYQACLEASFTDQAMPNPEALPDIAHLTHPTHFQPKSTLLELFAYRIHPTMARLATLIMA